MQFQFITPECEYFSGEAVEVSVPGTEGDFGVLAGHAPMISTLRTGIVTIHLADGSKQRIAVLGGVAEATPERCSVLAETAQSLEGVSLEDAEAALTAAQKAVRDAIHDDVRQRAVRDALLAETVVNAL